MPDDVYDDGDGNDYDVVDADDGVALRSIQRKAIWTKESETMCSVRLVPMYHQCTLTASTSVARV